MEIVPFEPEHGEMIMVPSKGQLERNEKDPGLKDYTPAILAQYGQAGPAYTLIVNDQVIVCAGIIIMWPGVGTAWAVASPLIEKYAIAGSSAVLRGMRDIIIEHKLHRVQAPVYEHFERGIRWVEFLGFHREGLMFGYGRNRENYWLFALTIDD